MIRVDSSQFIEDLRKLLLSIDKRNAVDIESYCIALFWILLEQEHSEDMDK